MAQFPVSKLQAQRIVMSYFIFTAIVVLAAAKDKVKIKDNQTNKEWKDHSNREKVVARKAS